MIGRLTGILLVKQAPELLLDVNGVGYEVQAPMSTFYQLPELGVRVSLHTHLVVREDAQLLYGFAELPERQLFRTLIKVNGVGPRLALTILSGMDVGQFVACVQSADTATLVKLPGVGKKTAERLLVETFWRRIVSWRALVSLDVGQLRTILGAPVTAIEAELSAICRVYESLVSGSKFDKRMRARQARLAWSSAPLISRSA